MVKLKAGMLMAGLLLSGCVSDEGARLSRQQPLPPAVVLKADRYGGLYRNVTIEEIAGAPEFRWFDGGAVLTTRPTRVQVLATLDDYLARTDMLAPSKIEGEYMLYVQFRDLHGPDMMWMSNKDASASIYFRLVRWRTGELVKQAEVNVAYDARYNGVRPEVVRRTIALVLLRPEAVANSTANVPVTVFTYSTRTSGSLTVDPLALSDRSTPLSPSSELGPADGTSRRYAAVRGMLSLAFDEFTDQLSKDGSLTYKRAVACSDLNPYYFNSHRSAVQLETADSYAVDCPGSRYKASRLKALYPQQFKTSSAELAPLPKPQNSGL